jgi:hypothetical protein
MPKTAYDSFKLKVEAVVEEILDGYKPTKIKDNKVIRDSVFGFNIFDLTPVLVSPAIRAQPPFQHTPWEPYRSRSCVA